MVCVPQLSDTFLKRPLVTVYRESQNNGRRLTQLWCFVSYDCCVWHEKTMVVESILDQPHRSERFPMSSQLTVHNNVWFQCDLTKSKSEGSVAVSYLSSCDAQWWWSLQIDSKGIQLQTCCGTGNLQFHKSHNEKTGKLINHLQACGQAMQLFRDFTRELKLFFFPSCPICRQWYFFTVSKWSSAPLGYKQLHFNFFIPWRKLAPSVWGCQGSSYSNYILSWIHQSLVVVMWPCLQDRQLLVSQFHLSNLIQLTKLGSPVVRLCSR